MSKFELPLKYHPGHQEIRQSNGKCIVTLYFNDKLIADQMKRNELGELMTDLLNEHLTISPESQLGGQHNYTQS